MTEKQYGGQTKINRNKGTKAKNIEQPKKTIKILQKRKRENSEKISEMNDEEKIIEAGKIASKVKKYAKDIIKKGVPLLEIAEKIEEKIIEFGGKPAFPTNLGINDVTAHYTPSYDDKTTASGLLKVDLGVHIDGWIADSAFSVDLENDEENKKLIKASENAVETAIKMIKYQTTLGEIGGAIQNEIESEGFYPITNLSGHMIKQYELHAGITIPNVKNSSEIKLEEGIYAIEPFITKGSGKVYDGKPSEIYLLSNYKNVRSPIAREVLQYIIEEYRTLPFCSRWIVKKFGTKALFGLKELENNGNLHHYNQLIESSHNKVAQSEQTILLKKDKKIITTLS